MEGQQNDGGQKASQHSPVKAEYTDPSGPVDLTLAKKPGDDAAAAHAEHIADGQHQCKGRAAEGDTCYQIGIPGGRNGPGVCQIV